VKPPKFRYLRAANLAEALEAMQTPEAKPLAGGQSLVPMLNFRLLRPALLVDINRLSELAGLEKTPAGGLKIGALVRHNRLETSPISFQSLPEDDIERRVATIGAVHPHVECKIIDPATGEIVPRGTAGELCTRGYSVMLGYWDDPAATAKAIDAARWMHTGDLGVMREDGTVVLVGRSKDTIIRGGENIYPREVEEFIHTLPKVADVQVVGVPDARYGEEVCAWVRLKPGESWTPEDLRAACRDRIATYKIPRYVKFVDEYPSTASGKVQKFRMREQAIVELGLGTAAPAAAQ